MSALKTIHVSYIKNDTEEYIGKSVMLGIYLVNEFKLWLNPERLATLMNDIIAVDNQAIKNFLYSCTYDPERV